MTEDVVTPRDLRFERVLDASIDTVWRYLVDPELRARWFMGGPTDLAVGGTFGMTMAHDNLSDGNAEVPEKYRPYLGKSWSERIVRLDPPRLLAITWENGDAGEVTFALDEADGGRTRLILTHTGLRGRDDAANFGGGWHAHLAVLDRRLRGEHVESFWALHAAAEAKAKAALG